MRILIYLLGGSAIQSKKKSLRLFSLMWTTTAIRPTTALRTLLGFVRSSRCTFNFRPLWAVNKERDIYIENDNGDEELVKRIAMPFEPTADFMEDEFD